MEYFDPKETTNCQVAKKSLSREKVGHHSLEI